MKLGVLSKAVLSQAGALLTVLLVLRSGLWSAPVSLFAAVTAHAVMAALIAKALRSEGWWILIHLIFTPTIAFALSLQLPSYWYLIGFVVLALIFGPAVRHRVPLYLSNHATQVVLSEYVARYWKGQQDQAHKHRPDRGGINQPGQGLHPTNRPPQLHRAPMPGLFADQPTNERTKGREPNARKLPKLLSFGVPQNADHRFAGRSEIGDRR